MAIRVETMKFHPLANQARVETMKNAMPGKVPFHAAFLKAVDMFPRTAICPDIKMDVSSHVETIVLLSKLYSKKYISVELPMDDMDLTSAESKATYKRIQNYVLEKFGFKVSTLYIAQVKRKWGLDVREHYNMSKNEKQKIPKCPIEKEEAILDALKHFKMIKDDF